MAKPPDPHNAEQMAPVKDVSADAAALGASQLGDLDPMNPIDECIRKWEVQNVYNSILSTNTEGFNYLHARLALLAKQLRELVPDPKKQ